MCVRVSKFPRRCQRAGHGDDETTDCVAHTLCAGFVPLCLETSVADGVVQRVPFSLDGLELGAVEEPDTWVRRMANMTGVWGWFDDCCCVVGWSGDFCLDVVVDVLRRVGSPLLNHNCLEVHVANTDVIHIRIEGSFQDLAPGCLVTERFHGHGEMATDDKVTISQDRQHALYVNFRKPMFRRDVSQDFNV